MVRCMRILKQEVLKALALCGVQNFNQLDRSFVVDAPPVVTPTVFSAFPLLDVEDKGY